MNAPFRLSKKQQKEEEKKQKELKKLEQQREKERKKREELRAKNRAKCLKNLKVPHQVHVCQYGQVSLIVLVAWL